MSVIGLIVVLFVVFSLRNQAYSNILKILSPTNKNFQLKIRIFFVFLLKTEDCGYLLEPHRRGGSNENPQSMFLRRIKKNNIYPCKPPFYFITWTQYTGIIRSEYIKVGFKGVKII